MPSTGDVSDPAGRLAAAPLVTAARQLAEREVIGLVWVGPDLVVDSIFGPLVRFVAIGEPLTSSIYALVGMEEDIVALKRRPGQALEVPDVTLVTAEGRRPRATMSIAWSEEDKAYVLVLARTESRSDLEIELAAQMRARLIAESELAAKSRELEQANADLESYASIISHDLQSPMRVLRYALDDLERMENASAAERQAGIQKVRELSRRMTSMLSALLEYASVTRKADVVAWVDTDALVRAVIASIDRPPGITMQLEGTWPRVKTMAAPLDLVLRNLIDNAVKHHDRPVGLVTISARETAGELTISVGDDGPGIPPENREAVFHPFRRMGDAPGHGMGLALIRRTLDGVGGRIEIASATPDGRGTAFRVHWPIR